MNTALALLKRYEGKEFTSSPSPFMQWLKPTVISVNEGELVFQYTIRKEMTNPFGTLHGGITAAIIDDIIGATMLSLGDSNYYMTINNVIDYFSPAILNEEIIAITKINRKGSQIVNAQCEVWKADRSKLVAKGYSNLIKTEIKK